MSEMNDIKTKTIGVLMGGPSRERDISIRSGKAVLAALASNGIKAMPIELDTSIDREDYRGALKEKISFLKIDIVFIALHGRFGEDGTVQDALEGIGIPYTGSRSHASRLGMDKISSKIIFESSNIPVPPYRILDKSTNPCNAAGYFNELGGELVVKPSNEGSSIGLSIVDSEKDFLAAVREAFNYSEKIIIEQYVRGREITVGILEDKALPIVEIIPKKRFFDFEAKYIKGLTDYIVPAEIDKASYDVSQELAFRAHKALGAVFFSRVDMMLAEERKPFVLEVNTVPGLTDSSLLPKAAASAGINFNSLIFKILESALW